MYIVRPPWLSHTDEQQQNPVEIYSLDVSPDGKRLATAGGDGHVRIWSTEAILWDVEQRKVFKKAQDREKQELKERWREEGKEWTTEHDEEWNKKMAKEWSEQLRPYTGPRQLCHMSHHLGTIHCVRFSPNGRYLASGADDKMICIYHLDKNPPTAIFGSSNEPKPVENWKTFKRLVGHENDVQDLAWSYDSSLLVSVGLDTKVVVWSGYTFEKLRTLSTHSTHVKGVCFDPANKYFATASDDRSIKIYRFTSPGPNSTAADMANNFVLEATISTPFKSSPLTTYFRRCSWSPDGQHIAASNAVNGPVSSVAIIERMRWDSEINLIGHEGPTEVCMFSPRLFSTIDPKEEEKQTNGNEDGGRPRNLVTVIASAGQDRTLTIWNTNTSRPLAIVENMAVTKAISDISWAPDGETLFASTLDGTVVGVAFDHDKRELGWVQTGEENIKALSKFGASRKGMGIAENVQGLALESRAKEGESRAVESRMGALMGDSQPVSKEQTPIPNGSKAKSATNGDAEADKSQESTDKAQERVKEMKARVTIGKDGKKRVAPMLVSSSGTAQSSLPQTQLVGSTASKNSQNDAPQTMLDLSKPFDGLPKGGISAMLLGNKRKFAADEDDEDEEPMPKRVTAGVPIVNTTTNGMIEPATLMPVQHGVVPTPEFLRPAVLSPSIAFSQVRLAVPKIMTHILRPLELGVLRAETTPEDAAKIANEQIILEARNDPNPKDPSHVLITKRGELVWQEFLPRAIILVAANKNFWAVACEDGSIHVWSPAGRRLLSPIILDAQPVVLECKDYYLLCITAVGLVHVWDLKSQSAPHPPVSMAPILDIAMTSLHQHSATPAPGVTSAHLNSTGHVIVTLTNGDGFYYSREMYAWQRLSEAWWAVGSQYWNSNDSSISALQSTAVGPSSATCPSVNPKPSISSGVIPYLERHTTTEFLLKGRAYALQRIIKTVMQKHEGDGFESSVSIAHLENRIAGALQLGSREEFRLYLFMYAKRLGAEGSQGKVQELLSSLLGGILEDEETKDISGKGWFGKGEKICGWNRMELLKGVVMVLGILSLHFYFTVVSNML